MFSNSETERVRGVVLDAVGTLIEPRPSVAQVYADAASRQGIEVDVGLIRTRFRQHFSEVTPEDSREPMETDEPNERWRWRRVVGLCLPEAPDPERAFDELWTHFGHHESWRVFDDVLPTLCALTDLGIAVRIASNFDGRLRRVLAGHAGLSAWSDPVVISSEIGYRKPHPAFFQAACASLKLEPQQVVFVGDEPENDVSGAVRAGCRAYLIDRDGRYRADWPILTRLTAIVARLA